MTVSKVIYLLIALLFLNFASPLFAQMAPNILLIIGDDMGVETLASYGVVDDPPTTAALDELASDGVRFTNFWSQPVCSPTRATLLTGRYGFRTGVGRPVDVGPMQEPPAKPNDAPGESFDHPNAASRADRALPRAPLSIEEFTLPRAIKQGSAQMYSTAAFGKWHLAGVANGWVDHPNAVGFDHFAGLMGGAPESFFAWNKVTNGVVTGEVGYAPKDKTDDAIEWIREQDDNPWFLWMAFNLGHTALHLPPPEYLQSDYSHLDRDEVRREYWADYFDAMMEAMDTEIGRLLGSLAPGVRENTYVIFMGDNGTFAPIAKEPYRTDRAKGTIYEGGVNVPLIVSGPAVESAAISNALVNSTDLFATILEMAGIDPDAVVPTNVTSDSVSFFPALANPSGQSARQWIYADEFFGGFAGVEGADYAMRNERYKLLRFEGQMEFYDLHSDPYEHEDLLQRSLSDTQRAAHLELEKQIADLRSSN
jgi:arylsulfatase B